MDHNAVRSPKVVCGPVLAPDAAVAYRCCPFSLLVPGSEPLASRAQRGTILQLTGVLMGPRQHITIVWPTGRSSDCSTPATRLARLTPNHSTPYAENLRCSESLS